MAGRICWKNGIMKNNSSPMEEDLDTSNLPFDIIENILSMLPVKSLLRFKSVSKSWYSVISDTKFARFHLHQSKKNLNYTTLSVCWHTVRPPKFPFLRLTNQNFQLEDLEFPLKKYREAKILCSCDGIVLLKNPRTSDKMCVLWNPSTRTYTKFSCPYLFPNISSTYGLCYDAFNDDYKVVLVITNTRFVVFSYKNDSWIENNDCSLLRMSDPGLFVNGALHWVGSGTRKDFDSDVIESQRLEQLHKHPDGHYLNYPVYECNYDNTYEICCFDPRDDKFKKLSKPVCFDISSVFHLTDLGGQLCLYRKTYDFTMVEIWTMNEYGDCNSWTKLLTVEIFPVPHNCNYVKILCLTTDRQIVLDIHRLGIVVYNPKENKFCEILVTGGWKTTWLKFMVSNPLLSWKGSLLLPNRINKTKRKRSELHKSMNNSS